MPCYAHDVRLVDSGDTLASTRLRIVEGVAGHALRRVPCNELDGLDDTIDNLHDGKCINENVSA